MLAYLKNVTKLLLYLYLQTLISSLAQRSFHNLFHLTYNFISTCFDNCRIETLCNEIRAISFTSSFCFTCALNCQLHRYNLDSFIVLFQVPYTHLETYFVNISFVKIVDQFFVIEFHTHLWHNYMVRIMFHLQLVHIVFHVHIFRFFQKIIFQHLFSYDKIRSQFQQNITNPKFHIYTK